jgi:hypothetical protein
VATICGRAHQQARDEKNQEHTEQDLGNPAAPAAMPPETRSAAISAMMEEHQCVVKHVDLLLV